MNFRSSEIRIESGAWITKTYTHQKYNWLVSRYILSKIYIFLWFNHLGPRKIPPHLDRHGTAQSHLSAISAQTLNPVLTSGPAANLDREKSFVSDASFARQETRGSLTSIREEDQRKKSERSGSLAPNKPAISESLKAEVNYIKVDFIFSFRIKCIEEISSIQFHPISFVTQSPWQKWNHKRPFLM